MTRSIALAATVLLAATAGAALSAGADTSLEQRFDSMVNSREMSDWMRQMASEPNHVGSPHDRLNAEWEMKKFQEYGWEAHIEEFQVLYPTPVAEAIEMKQGKKLFKATLQEKPIKGDTSARAKDKALPAYLEYQGDGDVTAPLVYVNYGMQDDYKALQRMGVDVKGKIVIARYGAGWRGLKPRLAADHGAVGCIIYSDPADDGYGHDATYPQGPERPPQGIQRGSVVDMTLYAGDPLTPGVGATRDAKRLTRETAPSLLHIPALPIGYGDAKVLLAALGGQVVPENWRGALPITYRVGPSAPKVHLMVKSEWSLKTVYDVVATMKGSELPDEWVLRGNHHDGWVQGAADPLSGQVALLEEARILGELAKQGWKPKRTIVYLSWDGEEPGLLGSTEWAEAHGDELKQKAVLYINTDGNERGFLDIAGSHDLEHFVNQVAADVTDPESHASVGDRRRAKIRTEAASGGGHDPAAAARLKEEAKTAADPAKDFPIDALGSGSDYSAFIEHLGVPSLNVAFGDEGENGGVYHSRYDTWEHFTRFEDPGFVYEAVLAKTVGRMVMRAADSDLPLQHAQNFAATMAGYVAELKKLADSRREAAETQAKLLADRSFQLAADPTKSTGDPTPLKPVPQFDFKGLDAAVDRLKASAKAYDDAFAAAAEALPADAKARLRDLMRTIDQTLTPDVGLPVRPWFKNLIYAPGRFTGYGAKTMPGIREAIEEERFDDATTYLGHTAGVLNAYADRLDQATAVLASK
ncbi:MAG TPA: M28 family peptidase [Rhizomicrobium sp.]|nr:M28 family peptidase [Rhizomicrobium sp.]